MYSAKCCFFTILPFLGCPAFHPVSVVSPLNQAQFGFGTQISRQVLMFLRAWFPSWLSASLKTLTGQPGRINLQPSRTPRLVVRHGVAGLPFPLIPLPNLQISSFGIITKNVQHSKCIWSSINDGFNPEFSLVIKHGPAALMAKFDVKTAYRNIAVHPDD